MGSARAQRLSDEMLRLRVGSFSGFQAGENKPGKKNPVQGEKKMIKSFEMFKPFIVPAYIGLIISIIMIASALAKLEKGQSDLRKQIDQIQEAIKK